MQQFGWLSERGGNIFKLLQKVGVSRKWSVPSENGGPTQEETMTNKPLPKMKQVPKNLENICLIEEN